MSELSGVIKRSRALRLKYDKPEFRSRDERNVARILTRLGIRWQYEARTFELPTTGEQYTPDLWCPDIGVFLEVKGGAPERLHKPWLLNQLFESEQSPHEDDPELDAWWSDENCLRVYIWQREYLWESHSDGWAHLNMGWAFCTKCGYWWPLDTERSYKCRRCGAWEGDHYIGAMLEHWEIASLGDKHGQYSEGVQTIEDWRPPRPEPIDWSQLAMSAPLTA